MTSTVRIEIEKRLGRRIQAEKDIKGLKAPNLLSSDAMKDFQKIYKEKREEYLDNSLMETHDMQVLLSALDHGCGKGYADNYIQWAWEDRQIDPEIQKYLDLRASEEAEKRIKAEKSDKKQGEIDGQTKLVIDDGSLAVPAGEVKSTTIDQFVKEINDLQTQIGYNDEQLEKLYRELGFDGSKLAEEQVTVYQDVKDCLIFRLQDKAYIDQCSPEIIEQVRAFIVAGDSTSAETILQHHFSEVVQLEDDAIPAAINAVGEHCEKLIADGALAEPQPLPPVDPEVIAKLPALDMPEETKAEILEYFKSANVALAVALITSYVTDTFVDLSTEDQGLMVEEAIANFENEVEALLASEQGQELNDLEKAAAKRKKGAAGGAKKTKATTKK